MTAPASFLRRRTLVEAMRVRTDDDLTTAQQWLTEHGVVGWLGSHALHILGPGSRMPLRIGQWLVRDVSLGDFTVCDDFEFRCSHQEVVR